MLEGLINGNLWDALSMVTENITVRSLVKSYHISILVYMNCFMLSMRYIWSSYECSRFANDRQVYMS